MATRSITREKVLAFRQRATYLHRRLPPGRLVEAAFAGLQDSSPRSAVLALHARVTDVSPSAWKDPGFVQVRIEWDGATTTWRIVEPPIGAPEPARLELARRFLRSTGPSTPQEFAWWSGGWAGSFGSSTRGELSDAQQTFRSLEKELAEV